MSSYFLFCFLFMNERVVLSYLLHINWSLFWMQFFTSLCNSSIYSAFAALHKHYCTYLCTTVVSWYCYCQVHIYQNSALIWILSFKHFWKNLSFVLSYVCKTQGFAFNYSFKCSAFLIKCSATQLTSSEMNSCVWEPSLNLHYTEILWQIQG